MVIPCYNSKEFLFEALTSVAKQTVMPEEVIVVDDGSTEDLANVVDQFSFVKYLRQENKGVSAARNHGVLSATGGWIAFLDSDDAWVPTKVERFKDLIAQQPDLDIVGSNITAGNPQQGWREIDFSRYFDQSKRSFAQLYRKNFLVTSTVVARKASLLKYGLFDESLKCAEDYKLWLAVARHGKVAMVFEPLTRYLSRPDGLSKNAFHLYRSTFDVIWQFRRDVSLPLFSLRFLRIVLGYVKSITVGFKY